MHGKKTRRNKPKPCHKIVNIFGSMVDISQYFQYPINDVAKYLDICVSTLKKICRTNGIERWPYRKIRCLMNLQERHPHDSQIKNAIQSIKNDPNINLSDLIPKCTRLRLMAVPSLHRQTKTPKKQIVRKKIQSVEPKTDILTLASICEEIYSTLD